MYRSNRRRDHSHAASPLQRAAARSFYRDLRFVTVLYGVGAIAVVLVATVYLGARSGAVSGMAAVLAFVAGVVRERAARFRADELP